MAALATTLPQWLVGVPVFAALLALSLRLIWTRSARHGVLTPVLVGFALRLAVTVGAHVASVLQGDGGMFFRDDRSYSESATSISGAWLDGHLVNPSDYDLAGSLAFGYPVLVALVYMLVGPVPFAAKLINVVISTAIVPLTALLGARLLGDRVKTAAAWATALLPTLVWWSSPLLKEPLVAFLVTGGLLAALSLPRLLGLAGLVAAIAGLLLTRIQAAAVLAGTVAVIGIACAGRERRTRSLYVVVAGALVLGVLALVLTGTRPLRYADQIWHSGAGMLGAHETAGGATLPSDVVRTMIAPFPWVFDAATKNWDRALFPGMWVLYALYPTMLVGLWRMRTRPFVLAYLLLPAAGFILVNAIFAGWTLRQRGSIEPLLVLIALAGADSWRAVAQRGAIAIACVAPIALVHARSTSVALAVGLLAGAVWWLAQRLPATPNDFTSDIGATPALVLDVRRPDASAWRRAAAAARGHRPSLRRRSS